MKMAEKPRVIECADGSLLCEWYEKGQRFGLSIETDGKISWFWISKTLPFFVDSGYLPDEVVKHIVKQQALNSTDSKELQECRTTIKHLRDTLYDIQRFMRILFSETGRIGTEIEETLEPEARESLIRATRNLCQKEQAALDTAGGE